MRLPLWRSSAAVFVLYRGIGYCELDVWRLYYRDGENVIVMKRVIEM